VGLGDLAYEQEKYEQAESLYQQTLRIWEQALGPQHPEVAYAYLCLADLSSKRGKYEQAEPLYRQALQIWEQATGLGYAEIAFPLNGLANLYLCQGKYAKAAPLYEHALRLREQHLGRTHPETAETLHDLARFHQKQGQLREALPLAADALQIRSQVLGEVHPKTVATRALYTQLFQAQSSAQVQGDAPLGAQEIPDPRRRAEHQAEEVSLPLDQAREQAPSEHDPLQAFLHACCERHLRAWCRSADLWQAYVCWVEEHQERFPLSRGAFSAQLKAHGCRADRTKSARIWRGIGLVNKDDDGR
jgi:tetratricopeptide (TPR) repeat protein